MHVAGIRRVVALDVRTAAVPRVELLVPVAQLELSRHDEFECGLKV